MSNWIEVNVQVTHEAVEAVSDILVSVGAHGVAIEDPQLINDLRNSGTWELCDIPEQENTEIVTVSAYYADDEKLQGRLAQIEEELNVIEERIGKFRFGNTRFRTVSEVDWANEWKQYFWTQWSLPSAASAVHRHRPSHSYGSPLQGQRHRILS